MLIKRNNQQKIIDYKKLYFRRDKNLEFDFRDYKSFKKIFRDIYYNKFSIEEAENMQEKFNAVLAAL